ncbi:MAG: hypothetical protein FJZ87_05110 [Chloroflexi bacterium]|nr:hypothetical protein [Chloroflexota bacterium]
MKESHESHNIACLNCDRSDQEVPLLMFTFGNQTRYICTACFPILVHKSEKLAHKLPGYVPPSDPSHEH